MRFGDAFAVNYMSRSYWHGWRNAQTDNGRTPVDINQQRLAHELVGAACRGH